MIDNHEQLYFPRGVLQTANSSIQMSLADYRVISDELYSKDSELEQLRAIIEKLTADNEKLTADNSELAGELTGVMNARDAATQQATQANEVVQQQAEKLREGIAAIERLTRELENRPLPVLVPEPSLPEVTGFTPVISRDRFENLIIGSIVKIDDAGTEDTMVREAIDKAVEIGCNSVTFWMHPLEVEAHLKHRDDYEIDTFQYAADRSIVVGADTVDAALRILPETVKDEAFNQYVDGLIALGAKYILWNDVDGVDENGERVYPPAAIKTGMARLRRALQEHPNIPVIASLTAGADLDSYRTEFGFDFVESQTFGTIPELRNFAKLDTDCLCLDTQADTPVNYLREARAIIVESGVSAIRLYPIFDGDTDMRRGKMASRVTEVKETLRQFREARVKVTV